MFFYSDIERSQEDFDRKIQGFINYSKEDAFSINLNSEQLLEFQMKFPQLKLTNISEANIQGILSFLCVFRK